MAYLGPKNKIKIRSSKTDEFIYEDDGTPFGANLSYIETSKGQYFEGDNSDSPGRVLVFSGKNCMKEIEFKGKAMEYFGIWLANILLTVVTIGIFSAWAKVRRLKYFYNNTNILENSFLYHAT